MSAQRKKSGEFEPIHARLKNHPSAAIRAEYLIRIEGVGPEKPQVQKLREAACSEDPLRSILKNRNPEGWWYASFPAGFYKKYQGSIWSLLFAVELGAPPDHPDLRHSCRHFLDSCYVDKNGAFSTNARPSHTIACFVAHACYFLLHFGFGEDERTKTALRWLAQNLDADDGMKCSVMDSCLNRGCVMALPKFLKAAALLNIPARKKLLGSSINRVQKKLLSIELDRYQPVEVTGWNKKIRSRNIGEIRELRKKERPSGDLRSKPSWSRLQFPLHYDSDLLEVLLGFARLGAKTHPVLRRGAERITALKGPPGWRHGRSLNGRMWADLKFEDDWISLRALEVLRAYPIPSAD